MAATGSERVETDDQGRAVRLGEVRRVVSLVPSLTEAIAETRPGLLAGVTNWCSHPADLAATRIGGTKNPDVARILGLAPDLVVANEEENRAADLDALRAAGIAVWVTEIRHLDQAFASLDRMLTRACALPRPRWLDQAEAAWAALPGAGVDPDQDAHPDPDSDPELARSPRRPVTAIVPIWRRPWMVLGRDTFAGDLLRRLGVRQLFADQAERYPTIALPDLRAAAPELVILPDEPYRFSADDGPEAFPGLHCALVSGRHLTWYGPSLADAPRILGRQLGDRRYRGESTPGFI